MQRLGERVVGRWPIVRLGRRLQAGSFALGAGEKPASRRAAFGCGAFFMMVAPNWPTTTGSGTT
jgi:hypothetical protein